MDNEQQLELFSDEPFCVRLKIEDAIRIFWDNYWKHLATSSTTKAHKKRLLFFFRDRFIDTISKADIEEFRRYLKTDGLGEQTINKAQMLLSRMFTKLLEYKEGGFAHGMDFRKLTIPTKNPCALVPKPRVKKREQVITKEILDRVRYYADDDLTDIINMLLYTKLRPGDLQRITHENIDLQRHRMSGVQHKTITTRNPSGVPFMIALDQKLEDIILPRLANTKPGTPLFPFKNMQKRWKFVREKAHALHVQLRDIRRTAATYLLDNGTDPHTVREGLGHTTLDMLPTYTPRTMVHQHDALVKLREGFE